MGGILSTNGDTQSAQHKKASAPHSPQLSALCETYARSSADTDHLQATACTITPRRTPGARISGFGSPRTPHFSPRKERFKFTPDERNKRIPSDANSLYADWPGDLYEAPMFCDFAREKHHRRHQMTARSGTADVGKENVIKSSIVLKLFDSTNTDSPIRAYSDNGSSDVSDTDDDWFACPHPGHERLGDEARAPKPLLSVRDLVICESFRLARNRRSQHGTDLTEEADGLASRDPNQSPTSFTASVGGALQSVLSW